MKTQVLSRSARHHIGKEVVYKGELAVVVGRYWRARTRQILYDVRIDPPEGGIPRRVPKVPEEEIGG
jgi:hypothetical protein